MYQKLAAKPAGGAYFLALGHPLALAGANQGARLALAKASGFAAVVSLKQPAGPTSLAPARALS